MQWSFKIGSIFGIPIKVHVTFLIFLIFIAGRSSGAAGLIAIGLIFGCVILHELGHSLAARKFGIPVDSITLWPIGGVASMRALPRSPWAEFVMAIAGPLVSVALGCLFALLAAKMYGPGIWHALLAGHHGVPLLGELASINVFLAAFNLIPAFPMDGGRVLRSILWSRKGFFRATSLAATIGKVLAVLFFVGALFSSKTTLILIAVFIYFGADSEGQMAAWMQALSQVPVAQAMQTNLASVRPDQTIEDAALLMSRTDQTNFPVMTVTEPAGVLTQPALFRAIRDGKFDRPIADFMTKELIYCRPDDNLATVMHVMDKRNLPCVLVVDADAIVGMVTPDQIYQAGKRTNER